MSKKTIIITGGTGYIGSHIAVELQQSGYEVALIDDLSNSEEEICAKIHKITGEYPDFYNFDLKDKDSLDRVFNFYDNIFAIIHCAGLKGGLDSRSRMFEYFDNNVVGTLNLLSLMKKHGVKNMLFASSCALYDDKGGDNIIESDKVETREPLATNKLIQENIMKDLSINEGFNIISLRYFNPIGAHPSGYIGDNYSKNSRNIHYIDKTIIHAIFDNVCGDADKVSIYGGEYKTSDGSPIRDYVDINDIAKANHCALKFMESYLLENKQNNEGIFGIVNIGSGKGVSIKELIMKVEKVTGKSVSYEIKEPRLGDLGRIVADISRANEFLGWKPTISIDESIKNTWNYIQKEKNLANNTN